MRKLLFFLGIILSQTNFASAPPATGTPTVQTQATGNITAAAAKGKGRIAAINGSNATNRGVIIYAYTDTDKTIADAGVTNVSEDGSFAVANYVESFSGLSANTHYNTRAHATNNSGIAYGARMDFWTLAKIPVVPILRNPTSSTLDLIIQENNNPSITEFAIAESGTGLYVQANGSLGAAEVWQTKTTWGTVTITGLTEGTTYTFSVAARNAAAVASNYGNTSSAIAGTKIFVDKDATGGSNNGGSWANAFIDLQSALDIVLTPQQIWVAEGTYFPSVEVGGTGSRYSAFQMKNGVGIYGGFNGTETSLDQRDFLTRITILSGDIGTAGDSTDNCYHIFFNRQVINPVLDNTAVLDGFTISDGNANSATYPFNTGGAMFNWGQSPTISNCIFKNNYGYAGGAIRNNSSSPHITDCTFKNNRADDGGGIYNTYTSNSVITNCTFTSNKGESGGAVQNDQSDAVYNFCTFTANSSINYGGAVQNFKSGNPVFNNNIFTANSAGIGGGAIFNDSASSAGFFNCLVYNNTAATYGAGVLNHKCTATFTNLTIAGNSAYYGGGVTNDASTVTVQNSIVWGNTGTTALQVGSSGSTVIVRYSCVAMGVNDTATNPSNRGTLTLSNNTALNPRFANQTPGDFTLFGISPCVNTGNNTYNATAAELRGQNRIQNTTIDMGAYEWTAGLDYTLPTCTTNDAVVLSYQSATLGGKITADGGKAVTEKGVVYATTTAPTIHTGTKVAMGSGSGDFSQDVTGMVQATKYYVRSYAINNVDTAYGDQKSFSTAYGIIELRHLGTLSYHPTIQHASDQAVQGDTIRLGAGTFIEQATITKGITMYGVDSIQTIIRAPLSADLVQTGGNWKNLKAQDVFAILGIKTGDASQVVIKNLKVDGFNQGYLPDAAYPNKNLYAFEGISALNSNLLLEAVFITRVRELASDYGQITPVGYLPADQPSGMNHNECIFAESASGAGNHTLEIKNSHVEKFQKTGILAWGPTLTVNIHNNVIRGYEKTLWSTGNGIQIASSDRSGSGGANGDRRGTSGSVTNNQVIGLGIIVPAPGEPESYLNLGLGGSTGIMLWQAASGFVIKGNTITRNDYIPTWHSSATSNDGGWSNQAIDIVSSINVNVDSNTALNFDHAIIIETSNETPNVSAVGNVFHNNTHDYFSGSGNDKFSLGSDPEVIAYYASDNGLDTISGFGTGDRLYVTDINMAGCVNGLIGGKPTVSFTGGTVTEGDGSVVVKHSVQIHRNNGYTTLFIDADTIADAAEIRITLAGNYYTGNFLLSGGYISYSCTNPTTGGVIGTSQHICSGTGPTSFTNISLPGNPGGKLQYKWQMTATSDSTVFSDIAGTDTSAYSAGTLTSTTWYRRMAKVTCMPDWTSAVVSNVIKVTADPATIGGTIAGDSAVCPGTNSTLLTLSGHTGVVQKWQYATDNASWVDMGSQTSTTYTAVNLTADTWYRVVVKSGGCLIQNSSAHKIKMLNSFKISGYAKYENNPKTPLTGVKITLRKNGSIVGVPVATGTNGYYEFTGLSTGTYNLQVSSADPSGQWQTWGGVNNTDYLLVAKHAAGLALLADTPPVVRVSASVKVPLPVINSVDADAVKRASTFGWGTPAYFDIPKWVFSGIDNFNRIDTFSLACANVTRDIRGLCAGDVNGTYVPGNGYKMAAPGLELVNKGLLPVTPEIVFPLSLARNQGEVKQQLGAITLMLNYNPSLIDITSVEMPENGGTVPEFVIGGDRDGGTAGLLKIGWMSLNPVTITAAEPLLLIHARLITTRSDLKSCIRFTLNDSQLNELADADGNILSDVALSIPDAATSPASRSSVLTVYPNPASQFVNIEYQMGRDGKFEASLQTIQGVTVSGINTDSKAGPNKISLDISNLPAGAYILRMNFDEQTEIRKIVVNR